MQFINACWSERSCQYLWQREQAQHKRVDFNPPTSVNMTQSPDAVVGWSFTANRDLYVTALGVYDHESDRRHEAPHEIGLWDSSGNLLRSATIFEAPNSAYISPVVGGKYHFENVSRYTLLAGQTYVIGATVGSDFYASFLNAQEAANHNLQFNSHISYLGGVYRDTSNQLLFPQSEPSDYIGNFGANIDVTPTPVPAAAWLLGSGLLGLAGIRRKEKKLDFSDGSTLANLQFDNITSDL
jgi:hypothetical protein